MAAYIKKNSEVCFMDEGTILYMDVFNHIYLIYPGVKEVKFYDAESYGITNENLKGYQKIEYVKDDGRVMIYHILFTEDKLEHDFKERVYVFLETENSLIKI